MHNSVWVLALALALVGPMASPRALAADDRISVESVVAFHTQCALCHEAECSGRMSFQLGAYAADAHIRRFAGALPEARVRQLGELLRYMKERCAFYPLPLALVKDRTWGPETLRRLGAADGTGYVLPLGRLGPAVYWVWLDGLGSGATVSTELITSDFESLAHAGIARVGGRTLLRFQVDAPAEVYLRIKAPAPTALQGVQLEPPDTGAVASRPPAPLP